MELYQYVLLYLFFGYAVAESSKNLSKIKIEFPVRVIIMLGWLPIVTAIIFYNAFFKKGKSE